jgi:hypothetical protein
MARRKFGDLIILLPGITGSVLQCHGKDAWAITPQSAISALFSLGGSIKDLEIKGKDDPSKDDLGDGVTAPRLVQDIHLIPGFWQIDGYTAIKTRLFAELTLEEGKNWFDYPYDWRRDNRVHGRQLGERAPRWLDARRAATRTRSSSCSRIPWAVSSPATSSNDTRAGRSRATSSRSARLIAAR